MDNTRCVIEEENPTIGLKNLFAAQSPKVIYKTEIFIFSILFGDNLDFYDVVRNLRVFV